MPEVAVNKDKKHKKIAGDKHVKPDPVVESTSVDAPKSKKKKSKENEEADENVSTKKKQKNVAEETKEVAEKSEKKKNKKRKFDEAMQQDEVEEEKPKKKLNILKQIEDPWQYQHQAAETSKLKSQEQDFGAPLASQKLKKIIPQNLEMAKKKRKKKSGPKVIPEKATSLPRPVWTSSGIFVEQSISPYKFKPTSYVPITGTASCATKFGVITFEAKKKKKQVAQQQPADFKTQMMYRNKKSRDGSMKNIRGLLSANNTN